jgi:hypothetical protein
VQLSTPAIVDASFKPMLIHTPILWEKLARNRKLFLRKDGCGGPVDSADRRTVKRPPEKLNPLSFDQPEVFEISPSVKVRDVLPGALVQVFVDDTSYSQAEMYSGRVTPSGWATLPRRHPVEAGVACHGGAVVRLRVWSSSYSPGILEE